MKETIHTLKDFVDHEIMCCQETEIRLSLNPHYEENLCNMSRKDALWEVKVILDEIVEHEQMALAHKIMKDNEPLLKKLGEE